MLLFHTQSVFLYRAPYKGGGTSCPIHTNGAATGPAYTPARNAKKGGVTLKLCINHKGNICENSDHLQLYKKWKGKSGENCTVLQKLTFKFYLVENRGATGLTLQYCNAIFRYLVTLGHGLLTVCHVMDYISLLKIVFI